MRKKERTPPGDRKIETEGRDFCSRSLRIQESRIPHVLYIHHQPIHCTSDGVISSCGVKIGEEREGGTENEGGDCSAMVDSVGLGSRAVVPEEEQEEEIDPWGGEDEVEHSPSRQSLDLEREWEARRLQFHNLGYRDGITAGNNSSVQEGFNVGFQEAVGPGFSWGVARGAASAFASLPSSLKELLLKDQGAGKRLEAFHSTLSNISSADALSMYYNDTILRKGVPGVDARQGRSSDARHNVSAGETRIEENSFATQSEPRDATNACCGGGPCGDSRGCSSKSVDGVETAARNSILDDSSAQSVSTDAREESSGNESVSEEAFQFISRIGTSSDDAKQLEDSTTSHLVSMVLGDPGTSTSITTVSVSSSRLEQYQRNVSSELEASGVKLSSFPQPS